MKSILALGFLATASGCGVIINGGVLKRCYDDCPIGEYEVPAGVHEIGSNNFEGCTDLTSIIFPEGLTTIGRNAFLRSGIKTIDLSGTKVSDISNYAFQESKVTSIKLPSTMTEIKPWAFAYMRDLTDVDLSESKVSSIGTEAFLSAGRNNGGYPGGLNTIQFPYEISTIAADAFSAPIKVEARYVESKPANAPECTGSCVENIICRDQFVLDEDTCVPDMTLAVSEVGVEHLEKRMKELNQCP